MEPQYMIPSNSLKLEQVSETDSVHSSAKEPFPQVPIFDEMGILRPSSVKIKQPEVCNNYPGQGLPMSKPVPVVAREIGTSGTPHLQKKKHHQLRTALCHQEEARSSDAVNAGYCRNQVGNRARGSDHQNSNFATKIRRTLLAMSKPDGLWQILRDDDMLSIFTRHLPRLQKILSDIEAHNNAIDFQAEFHTYQLRVFQREIVDIISTEADNSTVHWYYDGEGNTGKIWLIRMLMACHGAIGFDSARSTNIRDEYNGQRVVLFRFSRSETPKANYDVIQSMKSRVFSSTKYLPHTRVFKPPHVFVFSNFAPDVKKLSPYTWRVRHITDEDCQMLDEEYHHHPRSQPMDLEKLLVQPQ